MEGSKTRVIVEYHVEPVHKQAGESEVKAIKRMVSERAEKGFELIEACGDEVRMPNLIFANTLTGGIKTELKVEEIPHVKGKGKVDEIRNRLLDLNQDGWFPLCVLDSPLTPPIAVFSKSDKAPAVSRIEVIPLAISLLGQTAKVIEEEVLTQQLKDDLQLRTVMASALAPVLIFLPKDKKGLYEYLVEHAKGGLFSNASRRLADLIRSRSLEGWQVCGAFEDETFMPCVVFRRMTGDTPGGI